MVAKVWFKPRPHKLQRVESDAVQYWSEKTQKTTSIVSDQIITKEDWCMLHSTPQTGTTYQAFFPENEVAIWANNSTWGAILINSVTGARVKMPQLLATIFVQDQAYDDKLIKTSHLIKDEAPIMTNDRKDGERSASGQSYLIWWWSLSGNPEQQVTRVDEGPILIISSTDGDRAQLRTSWPTTLKRIWFSCSCCGWERVHNSELR